MNNNLEEVQRLLDQFKAATKGNHPKFGSSPVDPKILTELTRRLELLANDPVADRATKENMRGVRDQLAGYQLSFWLPRGYIRKALMFLFVTVAVIGAVRFSSFWLLFLVLAPAFSPRVVGEAAILLGRLTGQGRQIGG